MVQVTDALGAVATSYGYDAWGNEAAPDPNDANPWRYCGGHGLTENQVHLIDINTLDTKYCGTITDGFVIEWNGTGLEDIVNQLYVFVKSLLNVFIDNL